MLDSVTTQTLMDLYMSVGSLVMQRNAAVDFDDSIPNEKIKSCCIRYWTGFYGLRDKIITVNCDNVIVILSSPTIPLAINELCNLYSANALNYDFTKVQASFAEYLNTLFLKAIYAFLPNDLFDSSESMQNEIVRNIDLYPSITDNSNDYVDTTAVKDLNNYILHNDKCIVVTGNSSSGKTTVVSQAIEIAVTHGYSAHWFDFVNINTTLINVFCSLLKHSETDKKAVLVFDNAQARPTEVSKFIKICEDFFARIEVSVEIVLICWQSAYLLLEDVVLTTLNIKPQKITCSGNQQVKEIVRQKGYRHYLNDISRDSNGGDVFVATGILNYINEHQSYPTKAQLSEYIYKETIKDNALSADALHILYVIAALGEFEIHVREGYLQRISSDGIAELLKLGIIREYENDAGNRFIYFGHRSKANKIVIYMTEKYAAEAWMASPESVAIRYLKSEDNGQIHTMLERLDVEVRNSNNMFANLWKAFANVRTHLYSKVNRDPAWGMNMASMIFAAEALCKISFDKNAELYWAIQAKEIRKRWIPNEQLNGLSYVGDDCFTVNDTTYNMTNEIVDFTENIKERMIIEEQTIPYKECDCAADTDFYRFHDNWLLGLLLGFEGLAYDSDDSLKEQYIHCATNMQLDSGAFYPERVPWVTSRVIMGLAQCGLTVENSIITKSACEWLVNQLSFELDTEGQHFPCAGWRSGTGSWNSDIQITLMNLVALSMANYPLHANPDIMNTIEFTIFHAEDLAKNATNPLDIVWIIDILKLQREKDSLVRLNSLINTLTATTIQIWGEANKTAYDTQRESSDVSFLAKELLDIMWYIMTENLGNLLKGLEREIILPNQNKQIFISYRRKEGGGRLLAEYAYDYLTKSYKNDVFFDVYDLHSECTEFNDIISKAITASKVAIIVVSQDAFKRCIQPGYDIHKDVFLTEIKTILDNHISPIVVYYDSVELPDYLKQNKDCYDLAKKLSDMNAVFFMSNRPDAKKLLGLDIDAKIKPIILKR